MSHRKYKMSDMQVHFLPLQRHAQPHLLTTEQNTRTTSILLSIGTSQHSNPSTPPPPPPSKLHLPSRPFREWGVYSCCFPLSLIALLLRIFSRSEFNFNLVMDKFEGLIPTGTLA